MADTNQERPSNNKRLKTTNESKCALCNRLVRYIPGRCKNIQTRNDAK